MALTKAGIISTISKLAGMDRKSSEQSFEKVLEIIKSTLESGGKWHTSNSIEKFL